METLLPSEIARLVLGYLEDQKCIDAAKVFLETSPHLQECRTVVSKGRRFSTRVGGMTLVDVIEKFVSITTAIQERLSKIADCDQSRHCGDSLEQLKFLFEETRGQRFVVNINVPSQANTQISNGSPIISSNVRKRRHSNSDRERCKRLKVNLSQQSEFPVSTATGADSVEATPLESLPGHADTFYRSKCAKEEDDNACRRKHGDVGGDQDDRNGETDGVEENATTSKDDRTGHFCAFEKCTAATSTEQLLTYSCAEVQTTPYDTPESESETNDEPIENLSLLTKELLNRTELQERIAENINKAILPTDTSAKDVSLNDSVNSEANSSIMIELNNAIKSIVEATESDPIFEKFLDEIIGPHAETDTSPDEDTETRPRAKLSTTTTTTTDNTRERQQEPEANTAERGAASTDEKSSNETYGVVEVPLKHRLRSSSRQPNARVEDEQRDQEERREYDALEDQNAAAILSIINANIADTAKSSNDKRISDDMEDCQRAETESETRMFERSPNEDKLSGVKSTSVDNVNGRGDDSVDGNGNGNDVVESRMRKTSVRRARVAKPRHETVLDDATNEQKFEQDIMTMPVLIVCSKQEKTGTTVLAQSSVAGPRFVPIMPKDDPTAKNGKDFVEALYLKTVNVAQKVRAAPSPNASFAESKDLIVYASAALQACQKGFAKVSNGASNGTARSHDNSIGNPDVSSTTNNNADAAAAAATTTTTAKVYPPGEEAITLYGSGNSARTLLDSSNLPTINVEDSISLSGGELSPYIKFNCSKTHRNQSLSDIDLTPVVRNAQIADGTREIVAVEDDQQQQRRRRREPSALKTSERGVISKRTPRSLLRSRSKNHRLSLSTPRRRSNHVRALDFNTPSKMAIASNESMTRNRDENEPACSPSPKPGPTKRPKSVRRTSLFGSPSFHGYATANAHRSKNSSSSSSPPLKHCRSTSKPRVAAKSAEPKLVAGWDKCNGVGITIDGKVGDSTREKNATLLHACSETDGKTRAETSTRPASKHVWDADLRKALQITVDDGSRKRTTRKPSRIPKLPKSKRVVVESAKDKKTVALRKGRRRRDALLRAVEETSRSCVVSNDKTVAVRSMEKRDTSCNVVAKDEIGDRHRSKSAGDDDGEQKHEENSDKPVHERTEEEQPKAEGAPVQQRTVKRYAQLRTLETNLKKRNADGRKKHGSRGSNATSSDGLQRCSELSKVVSVEIAQQTPNLIALETPRKFQNSDVPPTPRLLSPSSIPTPFPKSSEDSSKLRSFINTPEFPTTPCIALTPKLASEGIVADDAKKEEFHGCSPYYRPTSEQNKCLEKSSSRTPRPGKDLENSSALVSQVSTQSLSSAQNIKRSSNTYQTCVSAKLEITQFEVIKENLPKEEAVKELKISRADSPTRYAKFKSDCARDNNADAVSKDNVVDNDDNNNSSCSSSSSSSSSSTSTSSTSSSSSSSSSPSSPISLSALSSPPPFTVNSNRSKGATSSPDRKSSTDRKCDKLSSQILHTEDPKVMTSENNLSRLNVNITDEPCGTEQTTIASRKDDSSPTKVFPIFENDHDPRNDTRETPAKDELLLDEADISETPSSSKTGVEHATTNLTTKISAFVSSVDEKSPRTKSIRGVTINESAATKSKEKPRIIGVRRVTSSETNSKSFVHLNSPSNKLTVRKRSVPPQEKTSSPIDKKRVTVLSQLEAKRRRMIAKFREISKSGSSSSGKPRKPSCIRLNAKRNNGSKNVHGHCKTVGKNGDRISGRRTWRKKTGKPEESDKNTSNDIVLWVKHRRSVAVDNNDNTDRVNENNCGGSSRRDDTNSTTEYTSSVQAVSTVEKYKCTNRHDETTNDRRGETNILCDETETFGTNETANRLENFNDTTVGKVASDVPDNVESNVGVVVREDRPSSIVFARNNEICNAGPTEKGRTGTTRAIGNGDAVENLPTDDKVDENDSREKKSEDRDCSKNDNNARENARRTTNEYPSCRGAVATGILKYKVDQVRRDLFSDEENEQRTTPAAAPFVLTNNDGEEIVVESYGERVDTENPKGLSHVLRCLQLIPAGNNEHTRSTVAVTTAGSTISAAAPSTHSTEFRRENNNHDDDTDPNAVATLVPNSVEYHYRYDEDAPLRKRRRRYSSEELEFQINIVSNEHGRDECVKLMTASHYEEIFNLPPKTRKRSGNRKSPVKIEPCSNHRVRELFEKPSTVAFTATSILGKPLAASSPLDKLPTMPKIKKLSIKSVVQATNEHDQEIQSNNRKKSKIVKSRESDDNSTAKILRRKLPESRENKQIEKRHYKTDPQTLLSNVDLDKFLTSVHGPA